MNTVPMEQANPDYDHFDPLAYYKQYYKDAEGDFAHKTYPLFPKLLQSMKDFPRRVSSVLDVGTGPILYASIVMRNYTDALYLSDYNRENREFLRKWTVGEELPYDFDYIADVVKTTEGSNEDVKDMKETVRHKIQAIFDVNLFDDNVIQDVHWKKDDNIDVPKKFPIVMSHYCLTNICQTEEGFQQCVQRTVDLIEQGGYLILAGYVQFPEYNVGNIIYKELSQTMEQILSTLKKCGMATEEGKGFGLIESHYDNANDKDRDFHENLHGEYVLISKKL